MKSFRTSATRNMLKFVKVFVNLLGNLQLELPVPLSAMRV